MGPWRAPVAMLLSLGLAGCNLGECTVGEERCVAGVIIACTAHPEHIEASLDPPSAHKVRASPNTWEPRVDCGGPALCQVRGEGAFCVLSPTPAPACGASTDQERVCDGTTLTSCTAGFAVETAVCQSCDVDAGLLACRGGIDEPCTADADCARGTSCVNGDCRLGCGCTDGGACAACEVLGARAPSGGGDYRWVCGAGWCTQSYR